jgi:hypothetical protein
MSIERARASGATLAVAERSNSEGQGGMKRISSLIVVAAAVVACLALPGPAVASSTHWSGAFQKQSGTLSFKLLRDRTGVVRLAALSFEKFPLECDGGPNTETAMLDPKYKPVQPRFPDLYFLAVYTKPHYAHPSSRLVLTGEVHKGGTRATGVMRIRGREVPTDDPGDGSSDHCDSGFVRWRATEQ